MARGFKLEKLDALTSALQRERTVYAPVLKGGEHVFSPLDGMEPFLGCAVTIMPPKRVMQPEIQTLFGYETKNGFSIGVPSLDEKQALFGVRPCDLHAIMGFDKVFGPPFNDPYWQERRRNTLIVAANCTTVAGECFCTSWGTGPGLDFGFDLLLTDLEDGYLLEVGSPAGEAVAKKLDLSPAADGDFEKKSRLLARAATEVKKSLGVRPIDLHGFLNERFDHPAWRPQADVCFSCGNCTIVCPTCYCFNVFEDYSPASDSGERKTEWDSCQLLEFSLVTRGLNFRPARIDRFKHRAFHKLSWMTEQYGTYGCVGCGRCVRWCPSWPVRRGQPTALADPVEIVGDLMEAV